MTCYTLLKFVMALVRRPAKSLMTTKLPQGALAVLRDLFSVNDKVKYGWKRWLTEADRTTAAFREACLEHDRFHWLQEHLRALEEPVGSVSSSWAPVQYPHLRQRARQDLYRWALQHRRPHALIWLLNRYPYDILQGDILLHVVHMDPKIIIALWRRERLDDQLGNYLKGKAALDWALQLDTAVVAQLNANGCLGEEAGRVGHLDMLRRLRASWRGYLPPSIACEAAAHRHLEVVQWMLHDACEPELLGFDSCKREDLRRWYESKRLRCWSLAMEGAISHGHRDIVQWLLEHKPPMSFVDDADAQLDLDAVMLVAAAHGHVDIVERLSRLSSSSPPHEVRQNNQRCVERAARHGHLALVQWMCARDPDLDPHLGALTNAARGGHLDVVKFLHDYNPNPDPTEVHRVMTVAAAHGHLEVVKLLHGNRPNVCTTDAMNEAATHGHLEVVQWLHEHRVQGCTCCTPHAMANAAAHGHLALVQWLHEHRADGCTPATMDWAAAGGHLKVVQWLHENRTEGCTTDAMNWAAINGHLEVVQWLHENRTEGCTRYALSAAASKGHLEIVQFLHEHRTEGCIPETINWAVAHGHLDTVMWWYRYRPERCTPSGRHYALGLQKRQLAPVLDWLSLYGGDV